MKKSHTVVLIQRLFRKMKNASFEHKLRDMNANFAFFDDMRIKLQVESQIKISKAWKTYVVKKIAKIEVD